MLRIPKLFATFIRLKIFWHHGKKRAGQAFNIIPIPRLYLFWLHNLRLARLPISHQANVNVVFWVIFFHIHQTQKTHIFYFKSRLFFYLAFCALLKRFHIFKVPARPRIFSRAVRTLAPSQKHLSVFKNKHADSHFWPWKFLLHYSWPTGFLSSKYKMAKG